MKKSFNTDFGRPDDEPPLSLRSEQEAQFFANELGISRLQVGDFQALFQKILNNVAKGARDDEPEQYTVTPIKFVRYLIKKKFVDGANGRDLNCARVPVTMSIILLLSCRALDTSMRRRAPIAAAAPQLRDPPLPPSTSTPYARPYRMWVRAVALARALRLASVTRHDYAVRREPRRCHLGCRGALALRPSLAAAGPRQNKIQF